ncbi:MAG TPA: hypothetical protein VGO58_13730 [Chitinophagaceae bacterium]|jgi:hypothetical protein|nr:hypothetical protein [Chitinophagaceae bacterium]
MKGLVKHRRKVALLLAFIMLLEFVLPTVAYGLTSGPSQPEMKGFEPIGNSEMVDLSSGDFSYNIPLMDVGGYPVNLVYHSGASMDEEASWVGYGWTLSPGVMNRQVRGLPDDFNGNDKLNKTVHMKDHITKGGSISATLEALGIPTPKIKLKKKKKTLSLNSSISLGVTFDNYRGVGVNIGLNSGLNITEMTTGMLTREDGSVKLDTNYSSGSTGTSFSLDLSSFDGAGVSASQNFNVLQKKNDNGEKEGITQSVGLGYNSRRGLTGLTLGTSFSTTKTEDVNDIEVTSTELGNQIYKSSISFAGETYTPTIDNPTEFNSYTFSFHFGPEVQIALIGLGGTGFYTKQKVTPKTREIPVFGYMNAHRALNNEDDAMMDFNREKDIPYSKSVNYLPVPVPTYDLFVASSQEGAGQYRAYKGSSGILFDPKTENKSFDASLGVEIGVFNWFDLGADVYVQDMKTITKKWKNRNNFLDNGDYQGPSASDPLFEATYFKRVGEPVPSDKDYLQKLQQTGPIAVSLSKNVLDPLLGAEATNKLRSLTSPDGQTIGSTLKRNKREVRNTTFSYLTASEASRHGLEKTIKDYHPDSLGLSSCPGGSVRTSISRTSGYRQSHHISEITITGDDGKISIYGIPVYNTHQEEVTFSVDQNLALRKKGITRYSSGTDNSINNTKGRDNYYSKEITPAYTTSYLLTGIVSPDYVDLKTDGITDDDLGTAVKFNYTKLGSDYKWRTPYAYGTDSANYNEGLLSDERDDKANYVYGEKEIWYMHSIESKTMVAHFITTDRDDALGVTGAAGAKNTSAKLRKLKEIRLYSKSDLRMNGGNPAATVPIKVVHFEYDYSVCKNLPNSASNQGKLVLKKIYFTFGQNNKGKLNPYTFQYDTTNYNYYDYRQYDRWGNLKDAAYNPGGLNNSEYPYTVQDSTIGAQFSSAGQLVKIGLPSGGSIQVTYESDDYAFVQDKRASVMCQINGVGALGDSTGLINDNDIYVDLPYPVSSLPDMKYRYFQDMESLYFKFYLDLDAKGHKEFVPGYAKITNLARVNDTTARVTVEEVQGTNPMAKAGWQFLRLNLPKYAYPGSDNYTDSGGDLVKAIKALVTAFGTITELFRNYEKKAENKGFSNKVSLKKSWVRLCAPTLKKLGGGSRVKKIVISDDWATMSAASGATTASFTQLYSYTTKDYKNNTISSGVASYEPMIGNDENPFRQPITYGQNQFLGLDNFFYIERPMGESFFPSASVVYSSVTVKTIGSGDAESVNRTGVTVSEFYTAKDFPTIVSELPLERRKPISDKIFKLIGGISISHIGLAQGYSVETNDMHGKPKSVNIFNKSGQNISSVDYSYKTVNELAAVKTLDNTVKVIDSTGTVSDALIGVDAEIYTDMRQQTTENIGVSAKLSGGLGSIFIFPIPFFFPGIGVNYDKRNYRSSSTIKIVNRFGLLYKTKKTENGSSITTENTLWDAETGNVLLTKTQNEFDDPVYSFAYPAHWIYGRMGQAYQNLGTVLTGFTTGSTGTISNSSYNSLLVPGDELIDVHTTAKYWVINSPISSVFQKRLIDSTGDTRQITGRTVKLVRSGRRNMANTAVATVVSLNNPIVGNKLNITQLTKVLDAKASVFSEEWSVPVNSKLGSSGTGCDISEDCMEWFMRACLVVNKGEFSVTKSPLYVTTSDDPISAADIIELSVVSPPSGCMNSFIGGMPADSFRFYQYDIDGTVGAFTISNGDSAQLGNCKLYFDYVASRLNDIANTVTEFNDLVNCTLKPCLKYISVVEDPAVPCGYAVVEGPCPLRMKGNQGEGGGDGCTATYDTIMKYRLSCPGASGCISPVDQKINPYYAGLLGNWRPDSQYAYHVNRENLVTDPAKTGSTDIRKSGAYSVFNPFWKRNTNWEMNPTSDIRWILANEVTYYNRKGIEIENKDALGRYSSAVFGYLESVPVAVASNTQSRELAYDGFEDYGFALDCAGQDTCNNAGHFSFRRLLNGSSVDTTKLYAHTGKYSLKVTSSTQLLKTVYTGPPGNLYSFDGSGRFILEANELSKGFSPIPGKKYVLSFWAKDATPRNPTTNVQATVNGTGLVSSLTAWPIAEGWKHIQVQFTLSGIATSFTLQLQSGGGTVYFDDIRIHPFDGQMRSYAYDASSQRLMAEMDENNFATFYEYDDEGTLIRVKKETERGIMTLKETRSSFRKQ